MEMTQTIRDLMTGDGKIEKGSGYSKKGSLFANCLFYYVGE